MMQDQALKHQPDALSDDLGRAIGEDFSLYDAAFLAKSLEKRLEATGSRNADAYLSRLKEDRAEAEAFCRSLNITYSEFFRSPLTFALLETTILPGLALEKASAGRPEIRIWSAGCAAGQEAYSVAILLGELAAPCRIFASDIAAAELDGARKGVYDAVALQNVRLRHLRHYFEQHGDAFWVSPQIREQIDFSEYDLLDPRLQCPPASIYGDFDLVFCCNLLLYYRPGVRKEIMDRLPGCLAPGGYLVTSDGERAIVAQAGGFAPVASPAAVFQSTQRRR
jgi:chemotaxis protein methyltransferase CheR